MFQENSQMAVDVKSNDDFISLNTKLFRYLTKLVLSHEREENGRITYSVLISLSGSYDGAGECLEIYCTDVRQLKFSQSDPAIPSLELRFLEMDGKYTIRDESHDECLSFSCNSVVAAR